MTMTDDQIKAAAVLYVSKVGAHPHLNEAEALSAAEAAIRVELDREVLLDAMRAVDAWGA